MLAATLALCAALAAAPAPADLPAGTRGDLAWFEGDFVAALDAAEASGQMIFIDFWADW